MEKSSKNYVSLFGGKPARGLPTPPPTPPRREIAHLTRGKCASAMCGRDFYSRDWLAENGGGGEKREMMPFINGWRINCKLKTKIANTILLLCYLDKMCLSPSGCLWQASAFLYSERIYKREPKPAASPQSTTLGSTVYTSVKEGSQPQQHTWNSKPLFFSRWNTAAHSLQYISNILWGLKVIGSRRLQ
jgi:hypothetical protein